MIRQFSKSLKTNQSIISLSYSIQLKDYLTKEHEDAESLIANDHMFYLIRNFPQMSDSDKTLTPYLTKDTAYGSRAFNTLQSIKLDHQL